LPPYSIKAKCGNKQVVVEKRPEAGVSKLLKEPVTSKILPAAIAAEKIKMTRLMNSIREYLSISLIYRYYLSRGWHT